jgi:ribosome assembly protein RRB1
MDDLEDGEDLEYDPSAYDCLHAFQLEWPCLR